MCNVLRVACCVLRVACCVLCVVCCAMFRCFAVSLHFNACDVTTQLAPDAPPPRRIQLHACWAQFSHPSCSRAVSTGSDEQWPLSHCSCDLRREVTFFAICCAQDWEVPLCSARLYSLSQALTPTPFSRRPWCLEEPLHSCMVHLRHEVRDGVSKLARWHPDQVLRGYRYHRLFSGDEHIPSLATVVDRPFEPTQLAFELLLSHQTGEERHLTADEVAVFVAIEVALRRDVCFLRLRTLPVRLTHSDVALCIHLNRGEPVGTTLCRRIRRRAAVSFTSSARAPSGAANETIHS